MAKRLAVPATKAVVSPTLAKTYSRFQKMLWSIESTRVDRDGCRRCKERCRLKRLAGLPLWARPHHPSQTVNHASKSDEVVSKN